MSPLSDHLSTPSLKTTIESDLFKTSPKTISDDRKESEQIMTDAPTDLTSVMPDTELMVTTNFNSSSPEVLHHSRHISYTAIIAGTCGTGVALLVIIAFGVKVYLVSRYVSLRRISNNE